MSTTEDLPADELKQDLEAQQQKEEVDTPKSPAAEEVEKKNDEGKETEGKEIEADNEETKEGEEKEKEPLSMATQGVLGVASAMILLWLVSMGVKNDSGVVIFAGIVSLAIGVIAAKVQYMDIEDTETLRTVMNELRSSVNDFMLENDRLEANNTRLEEELAPLKECEEGLAKLAEENGSDVEQLKQLVKENQEIIDETKDIQKQDVVQSLMQCLFDVDRNEDGELSSREIKRLRNTMTNLPSIEINDQLFEQKLEKHKGVATFIDMIHQINDESMSREERVFNISENETEKNDEEEEENEEGEGAKGDTALEENF